MSVIWGIPYLLIKVALRDLTPGTLVFARTAIAAILLVPIAARRGLLRPLLAKWQLLLVYTVVEIAGPWYLLSRAEQRLSSSLAGLLVASVPLIGAFTGAGILRKTPPDGYVVNFRASYAEETAEMVRGLTTLPNGPGKTVRVGVFARGPKAEEAQAAEWSA